METLSWKKQIWMVWLGLVALTLAGPFLRGTSGVLLALAGLKFIGISLVFMELRQAHVFWRALLLVILASVVAICLVSYRTFLT